MIHPKIGEPEAKPPIVSANSDPLFNAESAAIYLSEYDPPSIKTLERWRKLGIGPAWTKMGGLVRSRKSALDAYIEQCTRPTRSRLRSV
jgi:hypothetical protein